MTPKSRSYYDLDTFWSNGTPVSLEGVVKPNAAPVEAAVVEEVVSGKLVKLLALIVDHDAEHQIARDVIHDIYNSSVAFSM